MADINKLKDKIKSTIYPNGKGAINASDHQAMLLDMADGMAETDTKLAELSDEFGFISWERGSINEKGGLSSESDRVRSEYVSAPFQIDLNEGYSILRVLQYNKEKAFEQEYAYKPNLPLILDGESKLYRIVVIKDDGTTLSLDESFIKYIISTPTNNHFEQGIISNEKDIEDVRIDIDSAMHKNADVIVLESGSISSSDGGNINNSSIIRTRGYVSELTAEGIVLVNKETGKEAGGGKRFYDAKFKYLGTTQTSEAVYVRQIFDVSDQIDLGKVYARIGTKKYATQVYEKVLTSIPSNPEDYTALVEVISKNLINPSNISYSLRHSVGSKSLVNISSGEPYASTGFIEVTEGQIYCLSGDAIQGINSLSCQGGYYADVRYIRGSKAIENVTFYQAHNGGAYFKVPEGRGIKYVTILLNADSGNLVGKAQMEKGENPTAYEEYNPQPFIKESLLPTIDKEVSVDANALDVYTTFGNLSYGSISDKIPVFRKHWLAKDKDIVVVSTGTSLTARDYCKAHADAAYRPPLLHTENIASHLWDKLNWGKQEYRRYDAKITKDSDSSYFTETGTFVTAETDALWDDSSYRRSYTRLAASGNNAVKFIVPSSAWQFNFIYRTDAEGCDNCLINIAEGNGYMEVWTGDKWVEANGFAFSMKESGQASVQNVSIINPRTGILESVGSVQTHGNTTYQKRLKMRCVSHKVTLPNDTIKTEGVEKNVTISGNGRFMYWGVEWSSRQYMITYINASRGSHGPYISNSGANLCKYQDNEVWSFKPDLILTEDPIFNGGGGTANSWFSGGNPINPITYWEQVVENFFFADNKVSMAKRAETLLGYAPEFVIFGSYSTALDGKVDEDGELRLYPTIDGYMISVADSLMLVAQYMKDSHPDIIYLNCIQTWMEICTKIYANITEATEASGNVGASLTSDGVHPNTRGSRVWARLILPVLDFTNL